MTDIASAYCDLDWALEKLELIRKACDTGVSKWAPRNESLAAARVEAAYREILGILDD